MYHKNEPQNLYLYPMLSNKTVLDQANVRGSWKVPCPKFSEVNRISLLWTYYFDTLNLSRAAPNHYTLLRTFCLTHSANQVSIIGKNQFWNHLLWFILPHFRPCFFARINVSLLVLEHKSQCPMASSPQTSDYRSVF